MFSAPAFLCVGDEYDKPAARQAHEKTATPFVVPSKRRPHVLDSTFSPFVTLSTGDPYDARERLAASAGGTLASSSAAAQQQLPPFRPPGPPHKSSGKGDYYGTFAEKSVPPHESELPVVGSTTHTVQSLLSRPNFYTNPAKKGTYGYTGLTIGKAGEVKYVPDPYDGAQTAAVLQQQQRKAAHATASSSAPGSASTLPFCPAVRRGGCFDESRHGFTRVYSLTRPLEARRTNKAAGEGSRMDAQRRVWVPAGALMPSLTRTPEYVEDPYDLKERKRREQLSAERQYKSWTPAGTDRYRHIYTKPINYDPPMVV